MDVSDMLGGRYLSGANLSEPIEVTITGAERADIPDDKGGTERKVIVFFQELTKGLLCNKTNLNMLVHLFGKNTDNWVGKKVILQTEPVEFQGKVIDALRVKPLRTAVPAGRPTKKQPDDEVPF